MNSQLETLRDLAVKQAKSVLVGKVGAELVPSWVMIDENGRPMILATPWGNQIEKTFAVGKVRQLMRERQAIRYSFMTEMWFSELSKDEYERDPRRPSEREDRREGVVITLVDKRERETVSLEIIRDDRGVVKELRPVETEGELIEAFNRFANLLEEAS